MALNLSVGILKDTDTAKNSMTIGQPTDQTAKYTFDSQEYTFTLVDIAFTKQMYKPSEINARIQISPNTIKSADLQSLFKNAEVILKEGTNAIAENFYVQEFIPELAEDYLYVQLKIYSVDKLLDLEHNRNVYTKKKLYADILTSKAGTITLPYSSSTYLSSKISSQLQNQLKNDTSEYILPYTVQFDETFYDMLCRTANRWGEFVYFEDGTLIIGWKKYLKSDKTLDSKSITDISSVYSVMYASTDSSTATYRYNATNDEYLEKIEKGKYLKHEWDIVAGDGRYIHSGAQGFLNMESNLFDWLIDSKIDEAFAADKNTRYINAKTKEYDDAYFTGSDTTIAQFADPSSGLTAKNYETVLKNEQTAAQETLCVDVGTTYKHVRLGDVIIKDSKNYLVTKIECTTEDTVSLNEQKENENITSATIVHTKTLHFRIYAIKEVSTNIFYPPMIPAGHARMADPQMATIVATMDPKLNARYRIKYPWQGTTDTNYSPWIPVAHEMMAEETGSIWQLQKDTVVMVNYREGNVELPYIAGAIQTETKMAPRAIQFNKMSLSTPAGHAIRLSDGYGDGGNKFGQSMVPIFPFICGFSRNTTEISTVSDNMDACYEGGVELTDYFGVYSIKGSTDERSITISSPYGDVKLNAFTGINISAPNGDIKIRGKNVTIQAGNQVKIESGKNIKNALFGSMGQINGGTKNDVSMGGFLTALGEAFTNKVVDLLNLSLTRNALEVFLRPIDGTLDIKSNRYLLMQAGKGEALIPSSHKKTYNILWTFDVDKYASFYPRLANIIHIINSKVDEIFNTLTTKKQALDNARNAYSEARKALADAELQAAFKLTNPGDNESQKILTDVYNTGNPQEKKYQDGDFLVNAAVPSQAKNDMKAAVKAYADAAWDFYRYIKEYSQTHPLGENTILPTNPANPKTYYNDKLKAAAPTVSQENRTLALGAFAPNQYGNIDLEKRKKETKRRWFVVTFDNIQQDAQLGPLATLPGNENFPYQNESTYAAASTTKWDKYVKSLKRKKWAAASLFGKTLLNGIINKFAPFVTAILDRYRWQPASRGQIIMSDQPGQSIAFDINGTPEVWLNETTTSTDSGISALKQLLLDWDD